MVLPGSTTRFKVLGWGSQRGGFTGSKKFNVKRDVGVYGNVCNEKRPKIATNCRLVWSLNREFTPAKQLENNLPQVKVTKMLKIQNISVQS